MQAKKPRKPTQFARTRLSRPIRMKPLKKKSPRAKRLTWFPWPMSARAIALVAIGVVAAAMLIEAGEPSRRSHVAAVDVRADPNAAPDSDHVVASASPNAKAAQPETEKSAASRSPVADGATNAHGANAATATAPAVRIEKARVVESAATRVASKAPSAAVATKANADTIVANAGPVEPAKAPVAEAVAKAPAAESPTKADVASSGAVTITGCLETDQETFRLTDTSGADVPKSRSWTSGFLKKHSTSISLVDAAHTLRLPNYVGQRVAATGILMNREMRARSLQRVGASCS